LANNIIKIRIKHYPNGKLRLESGFLKENIGKCEEFNESDSLIFYVEYLNVFKC
jgi:hypothetical protein